MPAGHDPHRRYVRIGAIALVMSLGAFAFGHDYAHAQLGLDIVKNVRDAVKGKAKTKQAPGKGAADLLKGKRQNGPGGGADLVKGRFNNKGGFDRGARDKLTKDRIGGKDRFNTKDRVGTQDRFGTKDRVGSKDRLNTKDRLPKDKASRDTVARDKGGNRATQDRFAKDKGGEDRFGKDKAGKDRASATRTTALDKAGKGKADRFGAAKSNSALNRNGRFAKARTPVERGRIRIDHRRELTAARLLLPRRPYPGQVGFTGVPPRSETRFVATEMVFHAAANVSRQAVEAAALRHNMVVITAEPSAITGGTVYICRVAAGVSIASAVAAMEGERVGIAQPNYVFQITQDPASAAQSEGVPSEQYIIEKLHLAEVHRTATGNGVLVAVIDSKIDINHPDLAGAIAEEYDAVGRAEQPHAHGTGMVGAITAHQKLMGVAPGARILAVHAFSTSTQQTPEATTRQIIAGIEWAINKGARVINMSFAGPYDPMIQLAMRNASAKGVVLIAASGNTGPKSAPLYPAADPNVIAVTATDESDALFPQAVRGPHLAVAAPGVDVMVPAPADTYQLTTGTSVAAAHVSGVAALLIERHPTVDAATVLEVLTSTARNLAPNGRDDQFGWGLIDPAAALAELDSRVADGKAIASTKSSAPKSAAAKQIPTRTTGLIPASAKASVAR